MDAPYIGYGPWFCALLFNLNPTGNNTKQTELRVHSKADVFATLKNLYSSSDMWVTMMVVGPFYSYKHALSFFQLWSRQTRGRARRLKRAITLLQRYHKKYQLHLWVQSGSSDQLKQQIESERSAFQRRQQHRQQQKRKEQEKNKENRHLTLKQLKEKLK